MPTEKPERTDPRAELIELAENFHGVPTDALLLGPGEAAYFVVTNASLVEERRGKGHYQGGSSGISVPIGGRMRWRVGASRGHYVQGAPHPTAIDRGTAVITNKRLVFVGEHQTRECLFSKLLAVHHDDQEGQTTVSVEGRQNPVTVHYGAALAGSFDFRFTLAYADFKKERQQLIAQLRG